MTLDPYDLSKLNPVAFEHLVNLLALRILGRGHTGFGPGRDGGRDGLFEGKAPYPSETNQWDGIWYIQSKFLQPHLSKDPQKWLLEKILNELDEYDDDYGKRRWPDNWIVASNIEPSGVPSTGCFDSARALVNKRRPGLKGRFHIWGGRKIIDLLVEHEDIAKAYAVFITPSQVLSKIYDYIADDRATTEQITRDLIVTQFDEQQYTKLDQAGSDADNRPAIQDLFVDLPFANAATGSSGLALDDMVKTIELDHVQRALEFPTPEWRAWSCAPKRARVWLIKGGPGQGKSTLTQYVSQIQRAALILAPGGPNTSGAQRERACKVQFRAQAAGHWPASPRIPVNVELKDYAQWYGQRESSEPRRLVNYISSRISVSVGQEVATGTLRRMLEVTRWIFVLDGLDEVSSDVKQLISAEITYFVDDFLIGCNSDSVILCTSRPQGYAGQLDSMMAASVKLIELTRIQALKCAEPVIRIGRSDTEALHDVSILANALESESIQQIMKTPLQCHIMAVVIRGGGRPPERRWALFNNFYQVIRRREANRELLDIRLASILKNGDKLIKALHSRLGFELHSRAEKSEGATTSLRRDEFERIILDVVENLQEHDIAETVSSLMEAATERLVLVNTPDNGEQVRFDIRPLQEFFAAEYIHEAGAPELFEDKVRAIGADSHWREVVHFLFSGLVELQKKNELAASVKVLEDVDDAQGDQEIRYLARRTACGASMAIRLLSEGVLEQDRKVRQQFRNSLSPLWGRSDSSVLVGRVKPLHSRLWLCDVLVSALQEQSDVENIGVGGVLGKNMDDGHISESIVEAALGQKSVDYRAAVFRSAALDFDIETDHYMPTWFLRFAIRSLIQSDWLELGGEALRYIYSLLAADIGRATAAGAQLGLSGKVLELFPFIFSEDEMEGEGQPKRTVFGSVVLIQSRIPPEIRHWRWTKGALAALRAAGGMFESLTECFGIIQDARLRAVSLSQEKIRKLRDMTSYPESIQYGLPDLHWKSDGVQLADVLSTAKRATMLYERVYSIDISERVDWQGLISSYPKLALHIVSSTQGSKSDRTQEFVRELGGCAALARAVRESTTPGLVLNVFYVLNELDLRPGADRVLILEAIGAREPQVGYTNPIENFGWVQAGDENVLPHVVAYLVSVAFPVYHRFGRFANRLSVARALAKSLAIRVDQTVVGDCLGDSRSEIRAAATIIALIRGEVSDEEREEIAAKLPLYGAEISAEWFILGVATALFDDVAQGREWALRVLSGMLYRNRDSYEIREGVERITGMWKEASKAPVTTLNQPALWVM